MESHLNAVNILKLGKEDRNVWTAQSAVLEFFPRAAEERPAE